MAVVPLGLVLHFDNCEAHVVLIRMVEVFDLQ